MIKIEEEGSNGSKWSSAKSSNRRRNPSYASPQPPNKMSPLEKFRRSVEKVIRLNHLKRHNTGNWFTRIFFTQFNSLFKKKDIDEKDIKPLPEAVTSEHIMQKFDKVYNQLLEEGRKKREKKQRDEESTRMSRRARKKDSLKSIEHLEESVMMEIMNNSVIEDPPKKSKTESHPSFNSRLNQVSQKRDSASSKLSRGTSLGGPPIPIFGSFVNNMVLTQSMISYNPLSKLRVVKEQRMNQDLMMKAVFRIIRPKYIRAIVYSILGTIVSICIPYTMRSFLKEIAKDEKDNIFLFILAGVVSILTLVHGVLMEHALANTAGCKAMTGQIIRGVFFRKVTVCNYSFLKVTNESFINKMILYDLDHILNFIGELPKLWASPINLVLSFYFIFLTLSWRLLMVFAVFCGGVVLLNIVKRRSVDTLRRYQAMEVKKSTRIAECIPRMKSVKMNRLERYFHTKLSKIRKKESNSLLKLHVFDSISDSIFEGTPLFCSILIIGSLALLEGGLDPSKAFAAISVLEMLSTPLDALANSFDRMEAYSSAKEAFKLFLEEVPEKIRILPSEEWVQKGQILIQNCDFDFVEEECMTTILDKMMGEKWAKQKQLKLFEKQMKKLKTRGMSFRRQRTTSLIFSGSFRSASKTTISRGLDPNRSMKSLMLDEQNTKDANKYKTLLRDISVVIKPGQKVCLVGKPGSGFTEFLLSILGEAKISNNGKFMVGGSVSYLNIRMANFITGTIRRNIILGAEYDKKRFRRIIEMLNINLRNLRGEEYHQVLEDGKNLSVEMQRKILLARWIYVEKDIYLMDDLFDDLNRIEWNLIYQELFLNELKDKTVIFMSYTNIQIKVADLIVVFEDGMIKEQGQYIDLMRNQGGALNQIVMGDEEESSLLGKIMERTYKPNRSRRTSLFNPDKTFKSSFMKAFALQPPRAHRNFKRRQILMEFDEDSDSDSSSGSWADLEKEISKEDMESVLSSSRMIVVKRNSISSKPRSSRRKNSKMIKIKKEDSSRSSDKEKGKKKQEMALESRKGFPKAPIINLDLIEELEESEKKDKEKELENEKNKHSLSPKPSNSPQINKIEPTQGDKSPNLTSSLSLASKRSKFDEPSDLRSSAKKVKYIQNMSYKSIMKTSGNVVSEESLDFEQAINNLKRFLFLRGKWPLIFIILLFSVSSFFTVSYDLWIGFWSNSTFGKLGDNFYFYGYIALGVIGTLFLAGRDILYDCIMHASSSLINKIVIGNVLRLSMDWFDKQPVKRVMYRLTKDQSQMDIIIPKLVLGLIESSLMVLAGCAVVSWLFIILVPLECIVMVFVVRAILSRYLRTTLKIAHFVSVGKAEIVSISAQTLNLCVYMRSSGNLKYLERKYMEANNNFQMNVTNVGNFSQRWIGIRLAYISTLLVLTSFCYPMMPIDSVEFLSVDVYQIGLGITWSLKTIKYLKKFIRSNSLVFSNMISISRLYEYAKTKDSMEGRFKDKALKKDKEDSEKTSKKKKRGSIFPGTRGNNDEASSIPEPPSEDLELRGSMALEHPKPDNSPLALSVRRPNRIHAMKGLGEPDTTAASNNFSSNSQSSVNPLNPINLLKKYRMQSLSLHNVSMKTAGSRQILYNISMDFKANEVIGLYGRTMSGIPQLLELICGLYDRVRDQEHLSSSIKMSGQSIDNFTQKNWRSCFMFLEEEPMIVSGKVRDNIDPYKKFDDDIIIKTLDFLKFNELIAADENLGDSDLKDPEKVIDDGDAEEELNGLGGGQALSPKGKPGGMGGLDEQIKQEMPVIMENNNINLAEIKEEESENENVGESAVFLETGKKNNLENLPSPDLKNADNLDRRASQSDKWDFSDIGKPINPSTTGPLHRSSIDKKSTEDQQPPEINNKRTVFDMSTSKDVRITPKNKTGILRPNKGIGGKLSSTTSYGGILMGGLNPKKPGYRIHSHDGLPNNSQLQDPISAEDDILSKNATTKMVKSESNYGGQSISQTYPKIEINYLGKDTMLKKDPKEDSVSELKSQPANGYGVDFRANPNLAINALENANSMASLSLNKDGPSLMPRKHSSEKVDGNAIKELNSSNNSEFSISNKDLQTPRMAQTKDKDEFSLDKVPSPQGIVKQATFTTAMRQSFVKKQEMEQRRFSAMNYPLANGLRKKKMGKLISSLDNFMADQTPFKTKAEKLQATDPSFMFVNHDNVYDFNKEDQAISRHTISSHKVSKRHRQNIEDFLDYKVLPRAGNLTIGLKKLIFLAKVFLEEPSFVIVEENALDFDELDNQFFFEVLKGMNSTVIINMITMEFVNSLDRIFIFEKGHLKEFDVPANLLINRGSILHQETMTVAPHIIKQFKRKTLKILGATQKKKKKSINKTMLLNSIFKASGIFKQIKSRKPDQEDKKPGPASNSLGKTVSPRSMGQSRPSPPPALSPSLNLNNKMKERYSSPKAGILIQDGIKEEVDEWSGLDSPGEEVGTLKRNKGKS